MIQLEGHTLGSQNGHSCPLVLSGSETETILVFRNLAVLAAARSCRKHSGGNEHRCLDSPRNTFLISMRGPGVTQCNLGFPSYLSLYLSEEFAQEDT